MNFGEIRGPAWVLSNFADLRPPCPPTCPPKF